ncbi:MAG: CcdB family protein [Gammaproteobacteria bacterium]|nr:CcdB family protein [Gammaproteobacteria bacterium]MBU1832692.1 CcdB family protein [Gammaproteobacteria bacterium]
MAQFDVYLNPNLKTRNAYPYIIDIQNPLIEEIATRIVIPLGRLQHFKNQGMKNLTPEIEYDQEKLLLLTPQIASIPAASLNNPIGSLSHFRGEIIAALDFATVGI